MKRSSLFLLELLAMILVFSLCAALCVRMIGASWAIANESSRLTEAVYLAESAAARLQSAAAAEGLPLPALPEGYRMSTEEIEREGALRVERITVMFGGETIYTLDVTCGEGL